MERHNKQLRERYKKETDKNTTETYSEIMRYVFMEDDKDDELTWALWGYVFWLEENVNKSQGIIKDVTAQMRNEGNGEYTIPAWFARSLYEYIK